jgi:hypothetical protein
MHSILCSHNDNPRCCVLLQLQLNRRMRKQATSWNFDLRSIPRTNSHSRFSSRKRPLGSMTTGHEMSIDDQPQLLQRLSRPCSAAACLKAFDHPTDVVKSSATTSGAARICFRAPQSRSIRTTIFIHLGAFGVAKLTYTTNTHCVLDGAEE